MVLYNGRATVSSARCNGHRVAALLTKLRSSVNTIATRSRWTVGRCRFRPPSFVSDPTGRARARPVIKETFMRIRTIALGLSLFATAAVHADTLRPDPAASAAAFARLKTLVGRWEADIAGKKAGLTYELVAGGTTLLERETGANRPEMLTLYHLDGDRLLLTHYCMAGNQPRMELRAFDASTGEIAFDFLDASNLPSPAAGHMHSVTFRLVDANRIATEWRFYENGSAKMTEKAEYRRVR